ncbi:ISAs1 family transposase [Flammeovirgaceae bacterium SG7u.111]|nr:ISAs1 family transposase [Flammeovirgaceae bacterium SG7u.132]WPO38228.1 ISAs1 family transposase [Flammeovirgaceae bacterium SG7u.111]
MTLEEAFSTVRDPRRAQGQRISHIQLLSIVIISNLCGYLGGRAVARFAKAHSKTFTELLKLKHGVPSHVTISGLINRLDQQEMINAFNSWASSFVKLAGEDAVSGDGKALGSTVSNAHGQTQNFQAIVSLFTQKSGLVYSLETYRNKKESEIDVVRLLCSRLKDMGVTIFLDALHTQKNS